MHLHDNAPLTVAFALLAGMAGQALAKHARVPGIVLLLAFGVLLGPDVANLVQPDSLGEGLQSLVGFAVAVILFEGGMTLRLKRLARQSRAINQLISVGAFVSLLAGGAVAALVMGWDWRRSLLFGTLVIVTGPTVVTPILKRLKVKKTVSTVLEAEGVLIDAVGAITAAVALELVLSPGGSEVAMAAPTIAWRLLFGAVAGVVGGGLLAFLLRWRGVIPEGLENPFTLAGALLIFQLSNAVFHESGIAAVTIAGLVVGNVHSHAHRTLHSFKEQLTVMLIGLLFVLLVADVRLADIVALGAPGVIVALLTILLVRPLSVFVSTIRTDLRRNERVFIAWLGPRGIVAAAVASLFGYEMAREGIEGGTELRALVFLVIAVTVVWSALTSGLVARFLELKRRSDDGWLIIGANAFARQMAELLSAAGMQVVCVDHDPELVRAAQEEGIRALHGNALEDRTTGLAELDTRLGAIAMTTNEEVNYLFGEKAKLEFRDVRYLIAIKSETRGITRAMVEDFGGNVMFDGSTDVSLWCKRLESNEATVRWYRATSKKGLAGVLKAKAKTHVPLLHRRRRRTEPFTKGVRLRKGSEIAVLLETARLDEIQGALRIAGWEPVS
ncbi:MAG: cation:proton antiporter [Sandaracinaceae bacterium]